jgi:hypothetical protein
MPMRVEFWRLINEPMPTRMCMLLLMLALALGLVLPLSQMSPLPLVLLLIPLSTLAWAFDVDNFILLHCCMRKSQCCLRKSTSCVLNLASARVVFQVDYSQALESLWSSPSAASPISMLESSQLCTLVRIITRYM